MVALTCYAVYSNSLLATLNARESIRAAASSRSNEGMTMSLQGINTTSHIARPHNRRRSSGIAIKIDTETVHDLERDGDVSSKSFLNMDGNLPYVKHQSYETVTPADEYSKTTPGLDYKASPGHAV